MRIVFLLAALLLLVWQAPALGQPAQIDRHSAIYDPLTERTVVFGGYDGGSPLGDVWTLSIGGHPTWNLLTPGGPAPAARFGHSAIRDPQRQRMIVFGGAVPTATNETWILTLTEPPTWSEAAPLGTHPSARIYHSAVHDPVRDRMWVFGGSDGIFTRFDDVWTLSLGDTLRWEEVYPAGTSPSRRFDHSAIYDPPRDRILVFGGFERFDGLWELTLADTTWRLLSPLGDAPARRNGHTAVYDPDSDQMILFGGTDGNQQLDDVWALSLTAPHTWTQVMTPGLTPSPRTAHAAVHDSANAAMILIGGFPYGDDQTWALPLGAAPLWSPYTPLIVIPNMEVQLPTVTVGDTVAATFSVTNLGLEALQVSAIQFPSNDMTLSTPAPFELPWRTTVDQTLTLVARAPQSTLDTLIIESNDPAFPTRRLAVGTDVRDLDFETRVLGNPPEVPLGAAFVVVVTPDPGVRIERGTLFYRIAGTSAEFDTLTLTPLATDFIATVPASAVTEVGVEFYVEAQNSGFRAVEPPGAPAGALSFQAVAPATSMTAVPRPTSGPDFLEDRDIEIEVLLPDGATAVSGRLYFRAGGAAAAESDTLSGGILDRPIATIPARIVGSRGVEYWIEVQTERSALRFPSQAPNPAFIRTRVQDLIEATQHPGARYRLLSIPLDFGQDFSGSLDDLLIDQLGTYDPIRWRAYRYDPDSLRNIEFSAARASLFRPRPGRGFWLISRDAHRVDTGPIVGLSTGTAQPYPLVLAPGWNQFGNPFSFPVAWGDVIRDSTKILNPVAFDPTIGEAGGYLLDAPAVLEPFAGYFIENVGALPETLWVPAIETPAATPSPVAPTRAARHTAAATEWRLRLGARTERAADAINDFGVDPAARNEYDALDLREPPRAPGPWVQVGFANDWPTLAGRYRRDLRSPADGHTWEIDVRSAKRGETVTLDLSARSALPTDFAVRLIDRELGTIVEIDSPRRAEAGTAGPTRSHTIVSPGPDRAYRMSLVAGSKDFVLRAVQRTLTVPARLTVLPSAPNPFRFATQIRFALPRDSRVSIDIFSVRGERVTVLFDDAPFEAGHHAVIWDGRRSGGQSAASGVYLVRIDDGSESRSSRLVLIR